MRTEERAIDQGAFGPHPIDPAAEPGSQRRMILLVSNDGRLHEDLRSLANRRGHFVVRSDGIAAATVVLKAIRPAAVLVDLGLRDGKAWRTVEALMKQPACPAIILLAERDQHCERATTLPAMLLFDRNASPLRLLQAVEMSLQKCLGIIGVGDADEPSSPQRSPGSGSTSPTHRFWGINE